MRAGFLSHAISKGEMVMTEAKPKFRGSLVRRPLLAAALVASAVVPAPAMAAYDIFLKLDSVAGEVTSKGFEKWIRVEAYSLGFSNSGSTHLGGGGGAGKVNCQDIGLSKAFDSSSTALFTGVTTGKHFKNAQLEFVRTSGGGGPGAVFLKYELQEVLVTSLSDGGAAGGDNAPDENISLNFAKITVTYSPLDTKGLPSKSPPVTWNCASSTAN